MVVKNFARLRPSIQRKLRREAASRGETISDTGKRSKGGSGRTLAVTRSVEGGGSVTVTAGGKVTRFDASGQIVQQFQGEEQATQEFVRRESRNIAQRVAQFSQPQIQEATKLDKAGQFTAGIRRLKQKSLQNLQTLPRSFGVVGQVIQKKSIQVVGLTALPGLALIAPVTIPGLAGAAITQAKFQAGSFALRRLGVGKKLGEFGERIREETKDKEGLLVAGKAAVGLGAEFGEFFIERPVIAGVAVFAGGVSPAAVKVGKFALRGLAGFEVAKSVAGVEGGIPTPIGRVFEKQSLSAGIGRAGAFLTFSDVLPRISKALEGKKIKFSTKPGAARIKVVGKPGKVTFGKFKGLSPQQQRAFLKSKAPTGKKIGVVGKDILVKLSRGAKVTEKEFGKFLKSKKGRTSFSLQPARTGGKSFARISKALAVRGGGALAKAGVGAIVPIAVSKLPTLFTKFELVPKPRTPFPISPVRPPSLPAIRISGLPTIALPKIPPARISRAGGFSFEVNIPKLPPLGIPLIIPPLLPGGGGSDPLFRRRKGKRFRFTRFQPSVVAKALGITAKKIPSRLTGLEIRPIVL